MALNLDKDERDFAEALSLKRSLDAHRNEVKQRSGRYKLASSVAGGARLVAKNVPPPNAILSNYRSKS